MYIPVQAILGNLCNIIVLQQFSNIWVTIIENSPAVILKIPVFLYFFPVFPSYIHTLSNLVYLSGSGSSWLFSSHFCVQHFVRSSLLSPTSHVQTIFLFHPPLFPVLCQYFFILSFILFKIVLKIFISMACTLISLFGVVQVPS